MNILLSNDDGILSPGLWALVKELHGIAEITVVARTATERHRHMVTLRQPLRPQNYAADTGIDTYAVEGTPGDSVIVALEMVVRKSPTWLFRHQPGLNTAMMS